MKIRRVIGAAVLAGVVAIFGPAVAAASTGSFVNGTFTQGTYSQTYPGFETLVAGQPSATAMTGWTVTTNSVDWIQGLWTSPGGNSVDMNGTINQEPSGSTSAAGAIAQTFTTTNGATYFVSFELSANPGCGPNTYTLAVAGGTSSSYTASASTDGILADMTWSTEGYSFVAGDTGTSTLTFTADQNNTSNCGPVLADVAVTPVAASGAQCKDGGWQMGVVGSDGTIVTFKNQGQCVSYFATSGDTPIGS